MTHFSYLAESPLGRLVCQTAADLAGGIIPSGCPHPGAPGSSLRLDQRVLLCAGCYKATFTDPGPGECAACGAPDGSQWVTWPDTPAGVAVAARVCPRCVKAGNLSVAMN